MDLQFLQSIPDDRAAAVLTPDTDYSSPFNQASEAYKYGEDLFNDYQQYLICYHLQEVQTWMDEDISAGIVDEYLCELNQRDSQVPTSQSDNINHPPTSALTPPTYSREEKQSTWSPFPINTKDEFEAIEEILAKDEEKRERFVNFLKEHDSGNKRKLLTKWIKADALEHINMSGRTGKKKAMNCEIFLALLESWSFFGKETFKNTITKFLKCARVKLQQKKIYRRVLLSRKTSTPLHEYSCSPWQHFSEMSYTGVPFEIDMDLTN